VATALRHLLGKLLAHATDDETWLMWSTAIRHDRCKGYAARDERLRTGRHNGGARARRLRFRKRPNQADET
jgi:hypothetical protein